MLRHCLILFAALLFSTGLASPGQSAQSVQSLAQDKPVERRIKSPHYADLTMPQPLSLSQIQQQVLDSDTLLLEYALGDERSYLWAVTKTSITGHLLPRRAEIES